MQEPLRDFAVLAPTEGEPGDLQVPCVFCEIVAGRETASRIYEDDRVLAFLVLATVTAGHLVVIPKVHAETLDDLADEVASELILRARDLARALRTSELPCDGINLSLAEGIAAGQQVAHLHLHVVPRTLDDDYRVQGQRYLWTREQLDATAATLRSSLDHLDSDGQQPGSSGAADVVPRLRGDGFLLEAHRAADAEAMAAGADGEAQRWINEGYPSTVDSGRRAIERWQSSWDERGSQRTWAIRDAADGALAGGCELRLAADDAADFSYWIFPPYRGRGWAARALELIVDYAFTTLDIRRATLHIEPGNTASLRVATDAGFTHEGLLRDSGGALNGEPQETRHSFTLWSRLPSDSSPPMTIPGDTATPAKSQGVIQLLS